MPIDPAAAALIEVLDQTFPKVELAASAADAREQAKALPRLPDIEPVGDVEDRMIPRPDGEIPVRIYHPKGAAESRPGVVYFHGGGWVICDLDSHDGGCRRLTNAIDAVVVSVDYRLAPEHRWPAAADDAYAASRWVADHARELGIDPARLAVAGDSAGGNLTAVVAQMARDRDGPQLSYQLLVYPVTDVSTARHDYPSKRENAAGFFLTTASMEWYRDQYLAESAHGEDPYVSPIRATSLAGLPPACVVTAEMDPLRDEGEAYAAALEAAGVPVTTYRAPGMFHGFFNMDAVLEGSKLAQQAAFDAMRAALHGTS
jgi:acetyl esterase